MTHLITNGQTVVSRLVIRGGGMDTLATQMRMTGVLSAARLHPLGLPPSAVMFVRKLRDPLPGSLSLAPGGDPGVLAWENAANRAMETLARGAARPALEPAPASAEAVVFMDRSELLASLASDWLDGSAITHWWWRSLFRAADVASVVAGQWLTSIEYAPAAFARLAQKGIAVSFAAALPPGVVVRLLDEIIRHFGLAGLSISPSLSSGETPPRAPDAVDEPTPSRAEPLAPAMLSTNEVWELRTRWAPEAFSPSLERNARSLLAVALMLERAPAVLRRHSFASRLLPSLLALNTSETIAAPNAVQGSQEHSTQEIDPPAPGNEIRRGPIETSPVEKREAAVIESPDAPVEHPSARRIQHGGVNTAFEMTESDRSIARGLSAAPSASTEESILPGIKPPPATSGHRAADAAQTPPRSETEVTAATTEGSIETKMGGVFYLINAALGLNLYGDFTTPLEPGIELSIWDFLALIGRSFAGSQIEGDRIWPLLAKLAGRERGELPGAGFEPRDEWRIPAQWLAAFPDQDRWSYQAGGGRLIAWHPAGFTVLDVTLGRRFRIKEIEAMLEKQTGDYPNFAGFKRSFATRAIGRRNRERGIDRWTRWMTDYMRARLARALGASGTGELAAKLIARAARVEVSPARLDVFFALADLPVEIRLAGLDRNPGWVPAAGRAITFHYD